MGLGDSFGGVVDFITGGKEGEEGAAEAFRRFEGAASAALETSEARRAETRERRESRIRQRRVLDEAEFSVRSRSEAVRRLISSQRAAAGAAGTSSGTGTSLLSFQALLDTVEENSRILTGAVEDASAIGRQSRDVRRQLRFSQIAGGVRSVGSILGA